MQLTLPKRLGLGLQHTVAMFGATILMPLLTGLDPSVSLLAAGVGTLIFHLLTRRIVPVFLGSSFAFISPILIAQQSGASLSGVASGTVVTGLCYLVFAACAKWIGAKRIKQFFPPLVTGPIIIVIGLTVGYFSACAAGLINPASINTAHWFGLPHFTAFHIDLLSILLIAPISMVTLMEHIGDIMANGRVVGKDFFQNPGLQRTLLGDGVAVLHSIPAAVLGGISMLLFGMIASIGIRSLAEAKLDFSHARNLIIVSVILVLELSGITIKISAFQASSLALATFTGLLLNAFLPKEEIHHPHEKKI